jgi:DNA modification methylase
MNWKDVFPKENRYFETENCILYNADCLDISKQMPDNSVDLVITDPPYGVRKKEKWDDKIYFLNSIENWLKEYYRVSKLGVIWFCADIMIPEIMRITSKNNIVFHRLLIWNKPPGSQYTGAMRNKIWYSIEPILVFLKNENLTKIKNIQNYSYASFDARTIPQKKYNHPTVKPTNLMEWLIKHYSEEGHIILDPFMGSGTTGVACKNLNRNFIGIELNPEYCEMAKQRILGEI